MNKLSNFIFFKNFEALRFVLIKVFFYFLFLLHLFQKMLIIRYYLFFSEALQNVYSQKRKSVLFSRKSKNK